MKDDYVVQTSAIVNHYMDNRSFQIPANESY